MRDGRHVCTEPISELSVDDMIRRMVGRDLSALYPKQEAEIGEVVLEVEGLGRAGVFRDISFTVRAGEIVALAGLVGTRLLLSRSAKSAFVASSLLVSGLVLSAALAIFPYALPARIPGRELPLAVAAARSETLQSMLWWWLPGMLLASAYSALIYWRLPARFRVGEPH
jgi:cytochrome bd-type quinol oxidase subunit 2